MVEDGKEVKESKLITKGKCVCLCCKGRTGKDRLQTCRLWRKGDTISGMKLCARETEVKAD